MAAKASIDQLVRDVRTALNDVKQLNTKLPRIIGNESVKIVKENFKLQGYDSGSGVKPWPKRKASTDKAYDAKRKKGQQGNYKGSVYSSSNPLLMQTRNLFNSVKYTPAGKKVAIGVDTNLIPYAEAMNNTRQYIPKPSQPPNLKIIRAIGKKVSAEYDKAFDKFKK